jgi:hypothetical protein
MAAFKKSLGLAILLASPIFISCSTAPVGPDRDPASITEHYMGWLQKAGLQLQQPFVDAGTCTKTLNELNADLRAASPAFFQPKGLDAEELAGQFYAGKELRQKLRDQLTKLPGNVCREQGLRFLYLQRVAEEMFLGASKLTDSFTSFPAKENLRSGDILLMRGGTFFSASIAQLSNAGAPFSHSAIVYVDPQGKVSILESLAEIGVLGTSYEDYLAHHKKSPIPRIVHLRPRDSALGAKAAKLLKKQIDESIRLKKPILYDYVADVDDRTNMFCTEVVRWSYLDASQGKVNLPATRSSLSRLADRTSLPNDLGIRSRVIAMPADFEIDPFFRVIGEYRSAAVLPSAHRLDAVLSSMYEWMENDGYAIQKDFFRSGLTSGALFLRDMGILGGAVPKNVKPEFMNQFLSIYSISGALSKKLNQQKKLLTLSEMKSFLVKTRKVDCGAYKRGEYQPSRGGNSSGVLFHLEFRRNDGTCP